MFHGNKKKEKRTLTENELAKVELNINKLKDIQKSILDMRNNPNDPTPFETKLDRLLKATMLMPDFSTIWNYRKELILESKNRKTEDEFYTFLKGEVKAIMPVMLKSTKSYVLWYHRIWSLTHAAEYEKRKDFKLQASLLNGEIMLCDIFLKKDDRNFHCWNYRINIFDLVREYMPNCFDSFVLQEFEFTLSMIKKNFSNFSAWHYRSKLIPYVLKLQKISWESKEILSFLKVDLEYITNALYTDHKDQSPWNYHLWVLDNISPVYVEDIGFQVKDTAEVTLTIKLSSILKILSFVNVRRDASEYEIESGNKKIFSDTVVIKIKEWKVGDEIVIEGKGNNEESSNNKNCYAKLNLDFNPIRLRRINTANFEATEILSEAKLELRSELKLFFINQVKLVDALITNLTKSEIFSEFARFRKAQLLTFIYYLFNNPVFASGPKEIIDEAKGQKELLLRDITSEYSILKENKLLRMNTMYLGLFNKFSSLKV